VKAATGSWFGVRSLLLLCVRGLLMWLYIPAAAVVGAVAAVIRLGTGGGVTGPGPRAYVRSADNAVAHSLGRLLGLSRGPVLVKPREAADLPPVRLTDFY
jgi:hypothetical protein